MTLKEYLLNHGLTQQGFAVKLDVTQPTVARWCNAVQFPDVTYLMKIQAATDNSVTANDMVENWSRIHG